MHTITFVLAEGQAATTGTNKANEIIVPFDSTIVRAMAFAKTAPTGAALIFDINNNGTSIWSVTQANRVTIADSANEATPVTSFDNPSLVADDNVTIDIDQIGSGTAGQDITVELWCVPAATYYGDPLTDGSKRITNAGSNLVVQQRVSGTWETVHTFPAI